jgi:predicted ATPase
MNNKIIITGTMGSGKSAILKVLKDDGFPVVAECARTILAEQRAFSGHGVPEDDPNLFCELLLSRSLHEYKVNRSGNIVMFDRGLPDIIAYASLFGLELHHYQQCAQLNRYCNTIFLLEPWEEIYENDDERKMTFQQALDFHLNLTQVYESLNYNLCTVPNYTISERASFIKEHLETNYDS